MKILKSISIVFLFMLQQGFAQGFGNPLMFQGIDRFSNPSVVSKGSGGVTLGVQNDIDVMFSNPASLGMLNGLQFSVSNTQNYLDAKQVQQYSPLAYYNNFSLLMESLTGYISNPTYDTINHIPSTGADTVQRPFDAISPNWSRSASKNIPLQAFVAMPFSFDETKITIGMGMRQYANLDWYFQNNNVLNPSILSVDPNTTPIPLNNADSNSIPVNWSQYYQKRDGSINGYGGAVSILMGEKFSLGISGMVLDGSSDDVESSLQRGRLRFYSNFFRLEPAYNTVYQTGTSKYSGTEFTFSAQYTGKHVAFGFSLSPATEITRKYNGTVETHYGEYSYDSSASLWSHHDTTAVAVKSVNSTDKMTIPFRGTFSLSVNIRENLTVGLLYELRPYASAEYTNAGGTKTNPWTSANLFHVGVEYNAADWLVIRAGVHEQAEVFQPVGNPINGEPISSTVYSGGIGLLYENARLNFAYEYGAIKYTDMWASAVSINTENRQQISANISYVLPWK